MAFNSQDKQDIDIKKNKIQIYRGKTTHCIPYNHVQI